MKRVIAIVLIACTIAACTAWREMSTRQKVDAGTKVAGLVFDIASSFFYSNRAAFSPEDAARYEDYLSRFRLALDTGAGLSGYIERWFELEQGR